MVNYQFNTTFVPLRLELPDEDFYMQTDKNRLVQVISNLIDNALKFTKQGSVTLGYRAIPGFVEFSVEDTGIGISPDKLTVIFDRFERVDHFIPGSGLGLSICKSIVERMGGDISVTSEVGVGSVFSFRIPLEDAREIEERYGKTGAFTSL
jgi:signal transduction histidine kinase